MRLSIMSFAFWRLMPMLYTFPGHRVCIYHERLGTRVAVSLERYGQGHF